MKRYIIFLIIPFKYNSFNNLMEMIQMKRPNRNDLCWCGSGKKYKKCHIELDNKIYQYEEQGYIIPSLSVIKSVKQIEGIKKSGQLTGRILDMVATRIN